METDMQAYLQIGGAFDQLRHDEGGDPPIKMTTKIDNFIKTYMCQNRIPGLGLGIVWQGNLVYVKGYGLARGWETADEADDKPVRGQQTRFRWASVSKTVTGLASVIASQELDGAGDPYLDLDANLAFNYRCTNELCAYDLPTSWYPDWMEDMEADDWPIDIDPIPGDEDIYDITPRRLLANRAGVMHYGEGDPDGNSGVPSEGTKMANQGFVWAVDLWTPEPLLSLPGTTYNYSSFGFNMAGAALGWAVPGSYWSYVQSRIANLAQPSAMIYFHPDDVYDAQYAGAPWFTAQNRVHGYKKNALAEIIVNTTPGDVSYKLPSGGFISTVADLALYAHGLIDNTFLDAAGTAMLWTPQANAVNGVEPAPSSGYALGFSVGSQSGERLVAHNGKQQDGTSRIALFPDGEDESVGQLAIVVMSNAEHCSTTTVANGVEDLLRNPYVVDGPIVFEGILPRNPDFAAADAAGRLAAENGPYVNGGSYDDAHLDLYDTGDRSAFRLARHAYNPNYETGPRVPSPDRVPEDDDLEPSLK